MLCEGTDGHFEREPPPPEGPEPEECLGTILLGWGDLAGEGPSTELPLRLLGSGRDDVSLRGVEGVRNAGLEGSAVLRYAVNYVNFIINICIVSSPKMNK